MKDLEEIHARIADVHIKMQNLVTAYEFLINEMADRGFVPVHGENEHLKMPADPELGDTHH